MSHQDKNIQNCRVCRASFLKPPLLEYRNMPAVAQNFPDQTSLAQDSGISITVRQCSGCGLVQLENPPVPYYRDVIRASAYSSEMAEFRKVQFETFFHQNPLKDQKIIEIGCGRGEYLKLLQLFGNRVYGLEHLASSVKECQAQGLQVSQGFVESPNFPLEHAPFSGFFIFNFLEHIPDINAFLQGISNNLEESAVGLVEVPNFDMILEENLFSEFMRDHLYYFTRETLNQTLASNGFEVEEIQSIWKSYILSAKVRKRSKLDLSHFITRQKLLCQQLNEFVDRFPRGNVAVWGAGHQSLALLSLAELGQKLKCVIDSAPFKQGKFTPATHLPIQAPTYLSQASSIQAILIMAASYSNEIVKQIQTQYTNRFELAVVKAHGLERIHNQKGISECP